MEQDKSSSLFPEAGDDYFLTDDFEEGNYCSAHHDSYFFRPPKDDGSFSMSW